MILLQVDNTDKLTTPKLVDFLKNENYDVTLSSAYDKDFIFAKLNEVNEDAYPIPQVSKSAGILNFSSDCRSDFRLDPSLDKSALSAFNVSTESDYVLFEFCETSYKYPMVKTDDSAVNKNVEITNTSIRVLLQFDDKNIPVILEVTSGTNQEIIFGQDMILYIENLNAQ